MKQIEILSQFWNLFPHELTMKLTRWVGSLLQTCPPVPFKTLRPFNIRANLASRVVRKDPPSPAKTISWTHEGNSQLESFLNLPTFQFTPHFSVLQSNMFKNGRTLTCGVVVANLPPIDPTKQYVHCMRKVTTWCDFENLPPPRTFKTIRSIQHMKKVDMLSHCYRFIFRPPTKHFVRHMNRLGILSHVWNVFSFPYNKARRWTNKIGTSSHVWNLRPLDHTQQYIQHMDQVDMLIHSFGFTCPVPYETLCLVYEPAWHLYLCQNVPCLPLQQDNTLNTWKERHLESFLKFTVPRPYKAIR